MTTAQFIEKTYNVRASKERRCSSVFTDYQGTVYSYGYHYPLAFNVAGLDFINEQGYSSTTAKHIAWSRAALNYEYLPVKLWRDEAQVIASSYQLEDAKLDAIETALARELKSLMEQMEAKTRKDTQVYHDLMVQHERVYDALKQVLEARA